MLSRPPNLYQTSTLSAPSAVLFAALQYFEHLSAMIQLADNIPYHQLHGRAVAVLLGSSVQRPREVYCLHFPTVMHHPGKQFRHASYVQHVASCGQQIVSKETPWALVPCCHRHLGSGFAGAA